MRMVLVVRLLLALALAVASGGGAVAQGKITVDPNAAGSGAARESAEEDGSILTRDPRLSQKIACSASDKRVSVILEMLTEMTGVGLRAGQNDHDWQSRDRKMNIFAKDVPLRDLMQSMARVMKFKWRARGTDGAWVYRFYADKKALLDAEAEATAQKEREARYLAREREKLISSIEKLANLSQADLDKLRGENPYLYMLASSGLASSIVQLMSEVPAVKHAIATGQKMDVKAAGLSPAAQRAVLSSYHALRRMEKAVDGDHGDVDDVVPDPETLTIRLTSPAQDSTGQPDPVERLLLNEISICGDGVHSAKLPLVCPDSELAKLFGRVVSAAMEQDVRGDDLMKEFQPQLEQVVSSEIKTIDIGEQAVAYTADDPELEKKVTLDPSDFVLSPVQAAIADAAGVTVVSDSFGRGGFITPVRTRLAPKMELREALNVVADMAFYNWWKNGSVIEFRDRNWFAKQALLIPEAVLEGWRAKLKLTGTLDIDDLVRMAAYEQEALEMNMHGDEVMTAAGYPWHLRPYRDMLRFYGSLSADQAAAAFADTGLDLRSLTPEQWGLAGKLIVAKSSTWLQEPDAVIRLQAIRETAIRPDRDPTVVYTFTLTSSDDQPPIVLPVTTPVYAAALRSADGAAQAK